MECYYHESKSACGVCKSCLRGLCRDCAVLVNNGIACKGDCEVHANEIDSMISSSKEMEKQGRILVTSASPGTGELFAFALGCLFFGFGVYESQEFIMYMGIIFILFALIGIARVIKARWGRDAK